MGKGIKSDFSLMAILLIPVCVALNIIGFQIAGLLRLPIYLDVIGTILIGMLAGPWVAIVAGLVTNLINGVFNPVYFPYAIVSMAIGAAAGILSKYGYFQKVWKVIVSGIVITLLATIISAPITVLLFGGVTGNPSAIITAAFLASGQEIWSAVFSAQILTEIADKVLSAFICYFIVKSISDRYLSKLKYGSLYMKE
jgi:energy-coupling factor transport system substrate-specific component